MPKKDAPLTIEEVVEASDIFFPLFNEVSSRMPKGAQVEDTLRVMESIAKLAQKERAKKREEKTKEKFGFNKNACKEGSLQSSKDDDTSECETDTCSVSRMDDKKITD
jgi:hypothetical protein